MNTIHHSQWRTDGVIREAVLAELDDAEVQLAPSQAITYRVISADTCSGRSSERDVGDAVPYFQNIAVKLSKSLKPMAPPPSWLIRSQMDARFVAALGACRSDVWALLTAGPTWTAPSFDVASGPERFPWLETVYIRVAEGKPAKGLLLLISNVNELLAERDYRACNDLIGAVDLDRLDGLLLSGIIGILGPHSAHLPSYAHLFTSVEKLLTALVPDSVDAILSHFR